MENDYVIDLKNVHLTGSTVYIGENGVEGLQFELYNSTSKNSNSTKIIGYSRSCTSNFNSKFLRANSLVIDSISGCVDDKNLTYFPFIQFTHSFSQCTPDERFGTTVTSTTNSGTPSTIVTCTNNSISNLTLLCGSSSCNGKCFGNNGIYPYGCNLQFAPGYCQIQGTGCSYSNISQPVGYCCYISVLSGQLLKGFIIS